MKEYSVALSDETYAGIEKHLIRDDGQEDLLFAFYVPSTGSNRFSGIIKELILPKKGERILHGDVSFTSDYFDRVIDMHLQNPARGIALIHIHPMGEQWQELSYNDHVAEQGMAGAVHALTKLPLLGITFAGITGAISARFWKKKDGEWTPHHCHNTRTVGKALDVSYRQLTESDEEYLDRTIQAWGNTLHSKIINARVGIVGLGSVGSIVAEGLARMGIHKFVLVDGDEIKKVNLDRTINSTRKDVIDRRKKVSVARDAILESATTADVQIATFETFVQEHEAYRNLIDCDVIFSCVDKPLARSIVNFISYAHLIPVIDGGINCSKKDNDTLRSADWGVFVTSPGRACLECIGQYNLGDVQMEQEGLLDDPNYIDSLPSDHFAKKHENVIVFSLALAGQELLAFVNLFGRLSGTSADNYLKVSYPSNYVESGNERCNENCHYLNILGMGDLISPPI